MFNNSGSTWRKWDLHVHTPLDNEWINRPVFQNEEQKIQFAKEYIAFAVNENLSVLAITDHNFCNTLEDSLLPYIITEALINNITVLPGFEITVKDGSGIHLLVIFRENTPLHSIHEIVKRLFSLGTDLMQANVPVSNESIDDLKIILDDSKLDYVLIFAHADRENGVLDKGTIGGTRRVQEWQKEFIRICQLSKSPKEFEVGKFVYNVINNLDANYKRSMAYICASDCRSIDKTNLLEGRHYLGQKFTWIKANPTFEGLLEIQYEQSLRVCIQDNEPNQKIPYEVIKEVRFILDNAEDKHIFNPESIKLNPDLNVVIGGKSSGKSLFLYHIASTIDPVQTFKKEEGPDEKRKDKYGFKKTKIDFEVTWVNGAKQIISQNLRQDQTNYSILYIPQSYIQKLADTEGRKTRKEVGKIIREILLQKEEYNKQYSDFLTIVKRMDAERENIISQYITAVEIYKSGLESIKIIGDKNAIEKYILELKVQIQTLKQNSEVTTDIQERYNIYKENLHGLDSQLFVLKNDREKIQAFEYSLEKTATEISYKKSLLLSELKNVAVIAALQETLKPLDELQKLSMEIESKILNLLDGLIAKSELVINDEIVIVSEKLRPLSAKFVNREEIEKLENSISTELLKIDKITEYESEIQLKKLHKDELKKSLLDCYRKTYKQYVDIVDNLNKRSSEITELKLTGSVKFYTKRFYERLKESINNRQSGNFIDSNSLFEEEKDINDVEDINTIIERLNTLFDNIINDNIVLKGAVSKKDALNVLFKDEFFDYWEISSGKDEIANMSPGKAGLVLLKLLIELSDSKCPILIDQPEDNLDNRSIYSDLVQYIRSKKTQRQFIVVTHNPNIVVGADADNVIVANQNDQDPKRKNKNFQFDYISGALEYSFPKNEADENILTSMGIREHVTEILEGGKEAFQKRESKYRYH